MLFTYDQLRQYFEASINERNTMLLYLDQVLKITLQNLKEGVLASVEPAGIEESAKKHFLQAVQYWASSEQASIDFVDSVIKIVNQEKE